MSTILEALKKLERDKETDAAAQRAHDPLAPAPEPMIRPATGFSGGSTVWLVVAGVAVMFAIGLGVGLYTATDGGSTVAEGPGVATGPQPIARPTQRPEPVLGVEPVLDFEPVLGVEPVGRGAMPPSASAEVAAVSVPAQAGSGAARTESGAAPTGSGAAPTGSGATPTGSGATPTARAAAPDPWEAAAVAGSEDGEGESRAADTPSAAPSAVAAGPPSKGPRGVEIDDLPVVALPAAPVETSRAPAPAPVETSPPPAPAPVETSPPPAPAASRASSVEPAADAAAEGTGAV